MNEVELTMKITIRRWEVDFVLIDEYGEMVASNRTVFPKPASIEGIKSFMEGSIYRMADSFKSALYIWEDTDERE
jgi:hypothetical protein